MSGRELETGARRAVHAFLVGDTRLRVLRDRDGRILAVQHPDGTWREMR